MEHKTLVGKSYVFEDGCSIKITQVREREKNVYWITFETRTGPGIPRRSVMTVAEFDEHYGHLFRV